MIINGTRNIKKLLRIHGNILFFNLYDYKKSKEIIVKILLKSLES